MKAAARAASAPPAALADWAALDVRLRWAYRGRPAAAVSASRFDELGCWLIERGEVVVEAPDGRRETAGAGTIVVLPTSGATHRFSADAAIVSVRATARWPDGRQLFRLAEPLVAPLAAHRKLAAASRSIAAEAARRLGPDATNKAGKLAADLEDYLALAALTHVWLGELSAFIVERGIAPAGPGAGDVRVAEALRRMDETTAAETDDDEALASACGIGRRQLDRLFRRELGIGLRAYREQRRRAEALRLLTGTTLSAKEIAHRLGFLHAASFTHWLKRVSGRTPAQVRTADASNV